MNATIKNFKDGLKASKLLALVGYELNGTIELHTIGSNGSINKAVWDRGYRHGNLIALNGNQYLLPEQVMILN